MSKHTPGPWKEVRLVGGSHRVTTAAGCSIAEAFGAGVTDAPNAKLIAAAPDMLAELKRLRDVVGDEDVDCIEAVIAKAEGQP